MSNTHNLSLRKFIKTGVSAIALAGLSTFGLVSIANADKYPNKPIQLGLCCLNTTLRSQKPSIFASRKMIQRTIKEKGIEELKARILQNVNDVLKMMVWNEMNGIKVFRLFSNVTSHF